MTAAPEETVKIVAATLRVAANWAEDHTFEALLNETADRVESNWDGTCCPVCDEIDCDEGCPLEHIRPQLLRGDTEP